MNLSEQAMAKALVALLKGQEGLSVESEGAVYVRVLEGEIYAAGVIGDDGEIETEREFDGDLDGAIRYFITERRRRNHGNAGDDIQLEPPLSISGEEKTSLAAELIERVISLDRSGAAPVQLLQTLAGARLTKESTRALMQRAFHLDNDALQIITAWTSGDAEDEELNRHLAQHLG